MQANIKWLDDPRIFSVNQIKAHSDIVIMMNGNVTIAVFNKA